MIIGNGLVAGGFSPYATNDKFLVLAAGVSDSKTSTTRDFRREEALLRSQLAANPQKVVVYFGTTSVDDPDLRETPYVRHKLEMENLIRSEAGAFHIFRLSNLAGISPNPNTILNFFYTHIAEGIPFELWSRSERNIMDLEDVFRVADHIMQTGLFRDQTVNIANPGNYKAGYIIQCIEQYIGRKARYTEKERGGAFRIDTEDIRPLYLSQGIRFGEDYLPKLLKKYYPGA